MTEKGKKRKKEKLGKINSKGRNIKASSGPEEEILVYREGGKIFQNKGDQYRRIVVGRQRFGCQNGRDTCSLYLNTG